MARIIAGRFETQREADAAIDALRGAGFASAEYTSFYLMPAGQHDLQPLGGDSAHHGEGTKEAGKTAAAGSALGGVAGVAIGAAAAAAMEPGFTAIAAAAGAGVGAYAGSLAGGLAGTRHHDRSQATPDEPLTRRAGVMVAVRILDEGYERRAIDALRASGALEIERAEGQWVDGAWSDFDPTRTPERV